jgi:hypothetical protein
MQHIFMIPASVFHGIFVATLRSSSRSLLSKNAIAYVDNERNEMLNYRIYAINIKAELIALN